MGQITALLETLTLRQKLLIAGGALVVALLLWQGVRWNRESDLRPLFTNLAAEDAGMLVERLRAANVPYKVGEQGAILVPSARVAELRLDMAAAGLPRTGRIGFELFDKTNFGTTDFGEQVNYRRAIEGELERSIMALGEVERARVHVTFAKQSVFLDHREPAKASVMVKLRPGARLEARHLLGISHLTASAVEGLSPDGVSVVGMDGSLLSRPRRPLDEGEPGASDAMIEYRQSLEREMLAKIRMTLDPLLGDEKYRAGVSVECDFTSGEQSEERFDPDNSVMVTSQKTEDASGSAGAGGIPGTASNLPRPAPLAPGGGASVSRRTESISYQTSRVVKRTRIPRGAVKRLSVAVLVDHGVRWEGQGADSRRVLDAPPPEKLRVVRDLLAGVVGFQEQRGDQILVETLPFESTLSATLLPPAGGTPGQPTAAPFAVPGWMRPLLEVAPLAVWVGALLALLAVAVVAAIWFIRRRKPGALASVEPGPRAIGPERHGGDLEQKALAAIAETEAERARLEEEVLSTLRLPPSTKKSEVLKKHIAEQARKDPHATAQLVRTWLNDSEK
ncbi:MAG: flagellar M-ring protein FliF [Bryobacteraceae bacterium]|nr:flagellar M-ring protein FliF [Bryobacteraceae bacterium]